MMVEDASRNGLIFTLLANIRDKIGLSSQELHCTTIWEKLVQRVDHDNKIISLFGLKVKLTSKDPIQLKRSLFGFGKGKNKIIGQGEVEAQKFDPNYKATLDFLHDLVQYNIFMFLFFHFLTINIYPFLFFRYLIVKLLNLQMLIWLIQASLPQLKVLW